MRGDVTCEVNEAARTIDHLPVTAHREWYGTTRRLGVLGLVSVAIGSAVGQSIRTDPPPRRGALRGKTGSVRGKSSG